MVDENSEAPSKDDSLSEEDVNNKIEEEKDKVVDASKEQDPEGSEDAEEDEPKDEENECKVPEACVINRVIRRFPFLAPIRKKWVQILIVFLFSLIVFLNLLTRDFYFSSDSMWYGLNMKDWFETGSLAGFDLLRPAHPLTMPVAIGFHYIMSPFVGSDYLLSYAILNAILGAGTVAVFYGTFDRFVKSKKYLLLCAAGMMFSFAFWENCVMAEDKALGFFLFALFIPLIFMYFSAIKPFAWFDKLKKWQKGIIVGGLLALIIGSHISFVLLFLFVLFLGWRYRGLKFFKSQELIWFALSSALVTGIIFWMVAIVNGAGSIGELLDLILFFHQNPGDQSLFALSDPQNFSLEWQLRGTAGGLFTMFFFFISGSPMYRMGIIGIGSMVFLVISYMVLYSWKNKIVQSWYMFFAMWFAHFFFYVPDERNAWVYLLIPIWLIVAMSLTKMEREGIKLILLRIKVPDSRKKIITPLMIVIICALLVNNGIVISNAHFNVDNREKFVNFVDESIPDDDVIVIVDSSLEQFFNYHSEKEAVSFRGLFLSKQSRDNINSSIENQTKVYVGEHVLLDSQIKVGGGTHPRTYEARLEQHREMVALFDSWYNYTLAHSYDWSNVLVITEFNMTR
jgi:hypothetical protein